MKIKQAIYQVHSNQMFMFLKAAKFFKISETLLTRQKMQRKHIRGNTLIILNLMFQKKDLDVLDFRSGNSSGKTPNPNFPKSFDFVIIKFNSFTIYKTFKSKKGKRFSHRCFFHISQLPVLFNNCSPEIILPCMVFSKQFPRKKNKIKVEVAKDLSCL